MDEVRLGFVGCGFIAAAHAAMLAPVPDCHVGPVFDVDADRAAAFAGDTGARVVSSADAVAADCDAVIVCTWTSEHAAGVDAALAAGRAVLCEKPLGVDLAATRALARKVDEAGVVNQVGLVMRRSPAFRWLRHELTRAENGRPMNVVFRDDQYLPVQGQYASEWRADVVRAGGGALLEHSIHDLDLLDWLIGPIDRVSAVLGHAHGIEGIEDQATVTATTASGVQATLVSVWHDILRRPSGRRVEAFCADALLTIAGEWVGPVTREADDEQSELADRELHRWARDHDGDRGNPDGAFVVAVREGGPAAPDFAVALRAHELVDAAYRSAAQNGVPVPV
ncbi:MAG: Gfo/Idh/MocA family oxidoreductase [Acidimicrobiia bacterium]|nr:Gfo/Idh/MocA family oxidoreductase [Acidimicrobiia bacterium]